MGLGMCVVVPVGDAEAAAGAVDGASVVGRVVAGEGVTVA
jgi:phosphoribosylaminoimidazole (AIR) synthetase